jgi:hypothetical protein
VIGITPSDLLIGHVLLHFDCGPPSFPAFVDQDLERMSAKQKSTIEAVQVDMRGHRRVDVKLQVEMVIDRSTSCAASTENMSEGGVLLKGFRGAPLQRGRFVGLNVRGVLSDEDEDSQRYLMRVARQDGEAVALRFANEDGDRET